MRYRTLPAVTTLLLLNWTVGMAQQPEPKSPDDLAAQAAVFAFRAVLPDAARAAVQKYRLVPDERILSRHEVVRTLADLPKPVACRATADAAVPEIECVPLAGDSLRFWKLWVDSAVSEDLKALRAMDTVRLR